MVLEAERRTRFFGNVNALQFFGNMDYGVRGFPEFSVVVP